MRSGQPAGSATDLSAIDPPRDVEVLACDLDRTLIAEDVLLRERTRAAIAAARAAGIRVLLVTGRMFQSVRPYARAAGIDDPVVCYQGAVVADPESGAFLRHEPIPLDVALEVIAAVEELGFTLNCYVDDELYVAKRGPEAERYASFQNLQIHEVGSLSAWLEKPPTKLVVVGDSDVLDELVTPMRERFGSRLHISKSLPTFLEFSRAGVTKGSGLAFLAKHLGFARERTIAFGDGENDVEMLEWAGYAIAVANAHPRLLELADAVCPPAEEEGVAQVIELLLRARGASRTG
jgi:Cof subfamily protein (haloacid dehalogenase superfamily)